MVENDGRRYELRGRVAQMVHWLSTRADRLMESPKISITFDCAGQTVSAEIKERERVDPALLRRK